MAECARRPHTGTGGAGGRGASKRHSYVSRRKIVLSNLRSGSLRAIARLLPVISIRRLGRRNLCRRRRRFVSSRNSSKRLPRFVCDGGGSSKSEKLQIAKVLAQSENGLILHSAPARYEISHTNTGAHAHHEICSNLFHAAHTCCMPCNPTQQALAPSPNSLAALSFSCWPSLSGKTLEQTASETHPTCRSPPLGRPAGISMRIDSQTVRRRVHSNHLHTVHKPTNCFPSQTGRQLARLDSGGDTLGLMSGNLLPPLRSPAPLIKWRVCECRRRRFGVCACWPAITINLSAARRTGASERFTDTNGGH